jgi:hypothetical protein
MALGQWYMILHTWTFWLIDWLIEWLIDWLIKHLYTAHIHSIECSWRVANVLACSQKVSHPEMRLVSAASWRIIPFWEIWCTLVSVRFHNLMTYAQRLQDLYSACLMFWMRTHTGPRFIISSEGCESHQPKVIWRLIWVWKSLSLTGLEPWTSGIGDGRATTAPLALSCNAQDPPKACLLFLISLAQTFQHAWYAHFVLGFYW